MTVAELIGRVVALFLRNELAEDRTAQTDGTARFTIDCLRPEHTAAIARQILADPGLAGQVEMKLPERFLAGQGLPEEVLTPLPATYFRNAACGKPVLLIANTGDDIDIYGVHVSPDLDIVTFMLAGILDEQRQFGITGDTNALMDELAATGLDTWFSLGDRDYAVCHQPIQDQERWFRVYEEFVHLSCAEKYLRRVSREASASKDNSSESMRRAPAVSFGGRCGCRSPYESTS